MIASFVKRWGRKPKINESDLIQPLDYFNEMGEPRTEEIAKNWHKFTFYGTLTITNDPKNHFSR